MAEISPSSCAGGTARGSLGSRSVVTRTLLPPLAVVYVAHSCTICPPIASANFGGFAEPRASKIAEAACGATAPARHEKQRAPAASVRSMTIAPSRLGEFGEFARLFADNPPRPSPFSPSPPPTQPVPESSSRRAQSARRIIARLAEGMSRCGRERGAPSKVSLGVVDLCGRVVRAWRRTLGPKRVDGIASRPRVRRRTSPPASQQQRL